MYVKRVYLRNFRTYKDCLFDFTDKLNIIVGPNGIGKSNLLEAIFLLSHGYSFRTDKDIQTIRFGTQTALIQAEVLDDHQDTIETKLMIGRSTDSVRGPQKRYLINDVGKRRVDFANVFPSVVFSPADLDMIVGGPSIRRGFLDSTLEQISLSYNSCLSEYTKALRQRNALIQRIKARGSRDYKVFDYWDVLLVKNSEIIIEHRDKFIDYINNSKKDIFALKLFYNKHIISQNWFLEHRQDEIEAGFTLSGPHRDDFSILTDDAKEMKFFSSRGQQRLAILQLKLLQLIFTAKNTQKSPVLLLDDVFSELDKNHSKIVIKMTGDKQTIISALGLDVIPDVLLKQAKLLKIA